MSDPVPVKLAIQIRWRDLDALGHVNNAVYLTYFELARLAYIRALLGADAPIDPRTLLPADFQFILAEVTCHYRSPATLGDQLAATIWVSQVGRKSFVFEYRITTRSRGGWWPRGAARRSGSTTRQLRAGVPARSWRGWRAAGGADRECEISPEKHAGHARRRLKPTALRRCKPARGPVDRDSRPCTAD